MQTDDRRPDPILKGALAGNAAFSGASGLLLLLAAGPVGSWIGVGDLWILRGIGVGLLGFALALWRQARRPAPPRGFVVTASLSDFGWVAGSALLLVGFPGVLSPAGRWVVGIVALVVAGFGSVQLAGLRRTG